MLVLTYIILGILQGVFEWLPISSEGVLVLISHFFLEDVNPIDLALFLHSGTFFAVLLYFRKDWKDIFLMRNKRLTYFLIISAVISLAVGWPLYKFIGSAVLGSGLLFLTGFGLLLTAFFHKKKITSNLSFNKLAAIAGFLQGLAVIPGMSRSGATIFALSLGKINPPRVLKLSYLMSLPVVFASNIYFLSAKPALFSVNGLIAFIFSFLIGILTLHFLLKFSQKINFFKFTLIFGLLCLLGAGIGFLF